MCFEVFCRKLKYLIYDISYRDSSSINKINEEKTSVY